MEEAGSFVQAGLAVNGENFDGLVARDNHYFHRFFLRRPAYWTQDLPNPIATKANRARYGGGRLPKLAILTGPSSRPVLSIVERWLRARTRALGPCSMLTRHPTTIPGAGPPIFFGLARFLADAYFGLGDDARSGMSMGSETCHTTPIVRGPNS